MSKSSINVKALLKDPAGELSSLGLEPGREKDAVHALVKEVQAIKKKLKRQKSNKAKVAKDFKEVEKGSREYDALVCEMQRVSSEFGRTEEELKGAERRLRAFLEDCCEEESNKQPPLFRIPNENTSLVFRVRELTGSETPRWLAFVEGLKSAPNYCLPHWGDIIANAFSHQTRVWVAMTDDGRILGGVPLTVIDSRLFGRFAVSVPFFNYGGVLAEYRNVATSIMRYLHEVCELEGWRHVEVRTTQGGLELPVTSRKVSMILQLPGSERELDEQLGSKIRSQCKKAQAFSPVVRFGGGELLDDFYRVFSINMRDLGTPVYSKNWFRAILSHPKVRATLVVVYFEGKAVSTGFLVGQNGMLEIPWASTVRSANAMDANMWMYRKVLEFAVREGYEFFDFGRSTVDAGTYRFKKQWGAKPFPHHWYYVLPEGQRLPAMNPDNPKYKVVISVWKKLPVWVANTLGPRIVKDIP